MQSSSAENEENKNEPEGESPGAEGASADDSALAKAEMQQEIAHLKDQLLRAFAETENVRKRATRDQEETSKYAITGFARDLVNVIENLQRASQSIPVEAREGNELLKTLGEGVDMTMRELLSIFQRHGIVRIDPKGEKFNHNYHQAVSQVEDSSVPPGTVTQVFQSGYVIHDRLLRPAMVAVSKQGDVEKKLDTKA